MSALAIGTRRTPRASPSALKQQGTPSNRQRAGTPRERNMREDKTLYGRAMC